MQQLVDDDLLAEVSGLSQEASVEGQPPRRGAASPLAGHGADVDLLGLDFDSSGPGFDLGAEDLLGDRLLQGLPAGEFGLLGDHDDDLRSIRMMPWAMSTTFSTPASIRALSRARRT